MQFFINFFAYFGIVFLFSAAFFLQYRMFRFFDLSLGAMFLTGAYLFAAVVQAGQQEGLSILLAAIAAALTGVVFIEFMIRPLVRLGASPLDLTLCALGAYIIGVNVFALIFEDEISRPAGLGLSKTIAVATIVFSGAQISLILLALLSFIVVMLVLRLAPIGRTFRALGDSPNLARNLGLPVGPAIILATASGAALVGMSGALIAADIGIRPTTAFPFIIPGLAAVLAFGGQTLPQIFLGAGVVALAGELGGLLFGQQWREPSIFAIVVIVLALRTRFIRVIWR